MDPHGLIALEGVSTWTRVDACGLTPPALGTGGMAKAVPRVRFSSASAESPRSASLMLGDRDDGSMEADQVKGCAALPADHLAAGDLVTPGERDSLGGGPDPVTASSDHEPRNTTTRTLALHAHPLAVAASVPPEQRYPARLPGALS